MKQIAVKLFIVLAMSLLLQSGAIAMGSMFKAWSAYAGQTLKNKVSNIRISPGTTKTTSVGSGFALGTGIAGTAYLHSAESPADAEKKKKIVLWGLGYVLAEPNEVAMGIYLTPAACGINPMNYTNLASLNSAGHLAPQKLQETMNYIMNQARPHELQQKVTVDQNGTPHANIDSEFIMGIKSSKILYLEIQKSISKIEDADRLKKDSAQRIFKHPVHKYLIEATLQMRYLYPEAFGAFFQPIENGVKVLNECAAQPNNEMAMLTNWDKESFAVLRKQGHMKPVFKHFKNNNIFVSGEMKTAKPYPEAYKHVVEKMKANPQDFIFIDDSIRDVEAARAAGMQAIHLTDHKSAEAYKKVREQLKNLGAL